MYTTTYVLQVSQVWLRCSGKPAPPPGQVSFTAAGQAPDTHSAVLSVHSVQDGNYVDEEYGVACDLFSGLLNSRQFATGAEETRPGWRPACNLVPDREYSVSVSLMSWLKSNLS